MGGAIAGMLCAVGFMKYGPQRPDPFADEADEEENNPESETSEQTENYQSTETKQKDTPDLREEWYSPPHGSFI